MAAVTRAVQEALLPDGFCDFQLRWVFIATWHNVSRYSSSSTRYVCTCMPPVQKKIITAYFQEAYTLSRSFEYT